MATNTEVNVRINVDAKGADNSVGSIKKQLKEATNELINMREKFGDSSKEAVDAAKRVAELKDAIGDAKAMTDAFDPDAKFKAFGAALQGVAGGFAAVQGAQALFGSESEAVAQTLAKVQGAMALSQGINSVLQARDSFKNLGAVLQNVTVIQKALNFVMTGSFKTQQQVTQAKQSDIATTTAQTTATGGLTIAQNIARIAAIALRGAIMATGIGALVLGVMALVSAVKDWISGEEDATAAIEASSKALEAQQEEYRKTTDEIKYQTQIKKLQAETAGKSQEEIYQIEQKGRQDQIEASKQGYADLEKEANDYIQKVGELREDGNYYFTQEQLDHLNKIRDAQRSANKDLLDMQREFNIASLEQEKQRQESQLTYINDLNNLNTEAELSKIKDEDVRAKRKLELDHQNAIERIKLEKQDSEERQRELSLLDYKFIIDSNKLQDEQNKKKQQKADAAAKERKAKKDAELKAIADAEKSLNEQILELQNELMLMSIQNEDERAKKKLQIDYEKALKEIEQSKANENLKLDAILALNDKYQADLKAIDDEAAKRKIEFENETFKLLEENRINNIKDANDKAFEEESLRFQTEIDALYEQLNNKEITEEEFRKRREALEKVHETNITDITKKAAEDRANAHAAEVAAKNEVIDAYGSMVTGLVGVFKEAGLKTKGFQIASLIVEQAAAIAKIITSTQTANAAALATPQAVATSGAAAAPVILRNNLQAAISIATAVAAAAKGIAQIRGASANGSARGGASLPAGGGSLAPLPPTLSQTTLNQGQINQLSSATARAFVLESDVSGNQERIQRLNRAARIS